MANQEKLYTLIFVKNKDTQEILLGLKKAGFNKGLWNGFGGKVKKKESIIEGAQRELKEECGLTGKLRKIGVLYCSGRIKGKTAVIHVFDTYSYTGNLIDTEEMKPKWFKIKDIPYKEMNEDVPLWFNLMLEEKLFKGNFLYENEKLKTYKVEELTQLEEN